MNNVLINYLNQYNPSKIRSVVVPIVTAMQNPALPDAQLNGLISQALTKSQFPFDPIEYAEIKLNAAAVKYVRKNYGESKILINEAQPHVNNDPHRKAMTLWMLGINSLEMKDETFAFSQWLTASDILDEIIKGKYFPVTRPDMVDWYGARAKEISHLMAANCIQEIYRWYGAYDPSRMDDQVATFSKKIIKEIGDRRIAEAHQLIDRLLRLSDLNNDRDQKRDVYVFCGMAKYLLGVPNDSIKYFTEGIYKLEQKSQRQGVTYWLRGTAMWRIRNQREEALTNFNRAINMFKDLRLEADKKNNTAVTKWYDAKLVIMEAEVAKKVNSLLEL